MGNDRRLAARPAYRGDEVQVSLPHNKLYGNDRKLYYSESERAVYQGMELTEPPSNPPSFATGLDGEPAPHRLVGNLKKGKICGEAYQNAEIS